MVRQSEQTFFSITLAGRNALSRRAGLPAIAALILTGLNTEPLFFDEIVETFPNFEIEELTETLRNLESLHYIKSSTPIR